MKIISATILTLGLFTLFSCGGTDTENKVQTSLSGKVYSSSEGIDSTCQYIPRATDFYQTYLFLNDSQFVHIVNTCCPDTDEDFAYQFVSSGIYKMDDKSLSLTFNPQMAVCYVKTSMNETGDTSSVSSEHVELEKSDMTTAKLERLNCKETPYFKELEGDFKDEFVAPTLDTLNIYKTRLEKIGVWSKLFPN